MDYISGTTMPPSYEEEYRKEYENKIRNKAIDDCIKFWIQKNQNIMTY